MLPLVHRALVVVGHHLTVDSQPGFLHISQQVSRLVEIEHIVQPQVDEALAVVVEEV